MNRKDNHLTGSKDEYSGFYSLCSLLETEECDQQRVSQSGQTVPVLQIKQISTRLLQPVVTSLHSVVAN